MGALIRRISFSVLAHGERFRAGPLGHGALACVTIRVRLESLFRSFRTKLQVAFVSLGLAAIAVTGWQASAGAIEALRQASYDRLTAVRETRASELERYFAQMRSQVGALATDDSTVNALEQLQAAWPRIPVSAASPDALRDYYRKLGVPQSWFPQDPAALALQSEFLLSNSHPEGSKDLVLEAPRLGVYGEVHARFHPTFLRYKVAFGYYDVFLLSKDSGRVLYSVMKEVDIGVPLDSEPYRSGPLAAIYRKALAQEGENPVVMEDYSPYVASGMAPSAFLAAPIRRAGNVEGVLAIQVAIDEINGVMDGGRRWREQGLGATGQAYVVGPDDTLRSDLRHGIEDPEAYLAQLKESGIAPEVLDRIRRDGTAVLAYPLKLKLSESGTDLARDSRGVPVLRSHAPLRIEDLPWTIIAEIESDEAFQAVAALQRRIVLVGLAVAFIFFIAAGWLGVSVTGPVLMLASIVRRIGRGERGLRIPARGQDEVAQLSADVNRMMLELERTTVSKRELEVLAGRLITAQEDERSRVARELHDDFTQRLAAAAVQAGRLEKLAGDSEPVRSGLVQLKKQMAEISEEVHNLSRRLHPAMLDDLGLAASIEAECRAVFERGGPVVDIRINNLLPSVSKDAQLAIYRITQETLRNIQRHSGVHEADLHLSRVDDGIELEIMDRGLGFDRTLPGWHPGVGLASMEERTRLLGGRFQVESAPGKGTTIRVWFPSAGRVS
ncbi:MAG: histidine kinase [Bryobacteraceae bacterium]